MKYSVYVLLAAASMPSALACDLCSVYAGVDKQTGGNHGIFAGIAEQFTYFNTFQIDGHNVSNIGNQYLSSSVSQLFAGYNFNQRLGVQLNLPIIAREYGYEGKRGSDFGIGDLSLIGNVQLYSKQTEQFSFNWFGLGGVKFPTGSASHLNPEEEDFAPGIGGHDLTLGSGSYDGLVGTGFYLDWKRVFLTGTMQYAIRTQGEFGYQMANDWIWSGGPGVYLLLRDNYTLALQAVVSGESKGEDTLHGVATDDTAITAVYLGPQVNFTWSTRLSAQLGLDLPVSMVSTGEQIVPDYRIRAAVSWHF